jgi:hypothetical protein
LTSKIDHIIFILSYDHALIAWWQRKDLAPMPYLYLPLWSLEEGTEDSVYMPINDDMRRLTPHKSKKIARIPRTVVFESFIYSNNLDPTSTPRTELMMIAA